MSLGGCVATLVANDRQAELKGLILLAPAFRYVEKFRTVYQQADHYWHGNLKVGRSFLEDGLSADFKGALRSLLIPVCFFHGTNDTSVDPQVSQEFSEYSKNSELTMIEGTDHGFDTKEGYLELKRSIESIACRILLRDH